MKQVDNISVKELQAMASNRYGSFVKTVVDVRKKLVVVDAEMQVDEEQWLLEQGSVQADLWGVNLYPESFGTMKFIEYDSMINIRPRQQNRSRTIEAVEIRHQVEAIISGAVHD